MSSNEKLADQIISHLLRTSIDLKRETIFVPESADIASESEILGSIIAQYFKNVGRKIAETAYAAFDAAGLTVEALAFAELWRRSNPEQDDLWTTENEDLN